MLWFMVARQLREQLVLAGLRPARGLDAPTRSWLVTAARGGRRSRWTGWAGLLVLALLLFTVQGVFGLRWSYRRTWDEWPEGMADIWNDAGDGEWPRYLTVLAVDAAIVACQALYFRWYWLWMRARRVVRKRDCCAFCAHEIAGLPVDEETRVRCAECGLTTPAVHEWREVEEVVYGERPRFRPAAGLAPAFWTRHRTLWTARVAGSLAAAALLSWAGWWGIREARIRSQAAMARRERPDPAAINEKIREGWHGTEAPGTTVMDLAVQARDQYNTLYNKFVAQHDTDADRPRQINPDPSYITTRVWGDSDDDLAANIRYSRMLIDEVRQAGIFDLIDQIPGASSPPCPVYIPVDQPRNTGGELGAYRSVARLCAARLKLAWDAGNREEFSLALRSGGSVSTAACDGSMLINVLVGESIEQTMLGEVMGLLRAGGDRPWLDIIRSFTNSLPSRFAARMCEVEELATLDQLSWYFSDPSRIRKGLAAPELNDTFAIDMFKHIFGGEDPPEAERLGTYTENQKACKGLFAWLRKSLLLEPWQRSVDGVGAVPPPDGALAIIHADGQAMAQFLAGSDRTLLRRRGLMAMLAIEEFRASNGRYPTSLAEVDPSGSSEHLRDPFSGKPLGYRRLDASADQLHRGYLLWSAGRDGEDNQGVMSETGNDAALRERGKGYDLIINDGRWW
jgi:hypothetical protein